MKLSRGNNSRRGPLAILGIQGTCFTNTLYLKIYPFEGEKEIVDITFKNRKIFSLISLQQPRTHKIFKYCRVTMEHINQF